MPRIGHLLRVNRVRRLMCVAVAASVVPAVAVAPAIAARPTRGATYEAGSPGANTDVRLQVRRRASAFEDVDLTLFIRCSNQREGLGSLIWTRGVSQPRRVLIARDGSFSAMFRTAPEDLDPFTVSEQYWLSGRFTRRGKAARLLVRARLVGEAGTVCDSGDRHATARRSRPPV